MSATPDPRINLARQRLRSRRALEASLVAWLLVSAALIGIWWTSGAGYFWPGWVLGLGAVGLLRNGWQAFGRRPVSDQDILREAARLRRSGADPETNAELIIPARHRRRHRSRW